ncbi:MAG: class I SAM-dependent methyltransferase [Nocardioidaceae bacterium]
MSGESDQLFAHLAPDYEAHFCVPHRRAYDQLAWELTLEQLPPSPATVVDIGCGTGRWARRLVDLGYSTIGIEPCAEMARRAQADVPEMTLLPAPAEDAVLPAQSVDVTIAMGSLQYTDTAAVLARVTRWLRPGGLLCALVDSRLALGLELLRSGQTREAFDRLDTCRGCWTVDGISAPLRLYDRERLAAELTGAGLEVLAIRGLLIGTAVWGRDEVTRRLQTSWTEHLRLEQALTAREDLADSGKQLYVLARKPAH